MSELSEDAQDVQDAHQRWITTTDCWNLFSPLWDLNGIGVSFFSQAFLVCAVIAVRAEELGVKINHGGCGGHPEIPTGHHR